MFPQPWKVFQVAARKPASRGGTGVFSNDKGGKKDTLTPVFLREASCTIKHLDHCTLVY